MVSRKLEATMRVRECGRRAEVLAPAQGRLGVPMWSAVALALAWTIDGSYDATAAVLLKAHPKFPSNRIFEYGELLCGGVFKAFSNLFQSADALPAFILGALTAGGGITGYVRTGSIPSVVAGCTVGILVCACHSSYNLAHCSLTNGPSTAWAVFACSTSSRMESSLLSLPQSFSQVLPSHAQ